MISAYHYLISLFVLTTFCSSAYTQFVWKIKTETGYYSSQGSLLNNQDDILIRLDADLKYKYRNNNNVASVDMKILPEFYGLENQLRITKLRARGSYLQKRKKMNLGFNLTTHRYFFSGAGLDLSFNNLILETHLLWLKHSTQFFQANIGYAYQSTHRVGDLNLDLLFLQGSWYQPINKYFKYSYGIYVEKFYIAYDIDYNTHISKANNAGWRVGPLILLNYLKDFLLNIDYRFLLHYSDLTTYPSYQQKLRFLLGKIFYSRYSTFLVVDYYIREFKRKSDTVEEINVLYTPINLQNRIFFKFAYDIKDNIEIYVRYGYFKESLYYQDYQLAGWSGLIGIEISN
jgi:hypothetical protein